MIKKKRLAKQEFENFKNNLKELLGEYLSIRKDSQYEIIETIMKMKVFEGKTKEIDFLREALSHKKDSHDMNSLQLFMKKKGMLLSTAIIRGYQTKTDTGPTTKVS